MPSRHDGRALVVATYNVLADEYVRPEFYPRCSLDDFKPEHRHPRLMTRVAALAADAICLQEVTSEMFGRLEATLAPRGYRGIWERKAGDKPDGCATFYRAPIVCADTLALTYDDGGADKPSGHVALGAILEVGGRSALLVNTHIKWDKPGTPEAKRRGLAQARQLIASLVGIPRAIVCADLNAVPEDRMLTAFREAGFADAHDASAATYIADGAPKKLDYLLHNGGFRATPIAPPPITGATPLPSASEPSDHLPLLAAFTFA